MHSCITRADTQRPVPGACVSALVVLLLLATGGCRNSAADAGSDSTPGPPRIVLSVGDSLTFDSWALDEFGDRIFSTFTKTVWRVIAVGGTYAGAAGVTTIVERAAPGSPPVPNDTLYFQLQANGDIAQYGFVARIVKLRGGRTLVATWDRIAAFSLPGGSSWTVGAKDSAGTDFIYGRVVDGTEYFSANVNGVETLFRGNSVTMVGTDYQYMLSISAAPPCFTRLHEESTGATRGFLRVLSALYVAGWR